MLKEKIARYCNKQGMLVKDFPKMIGMSKSTYYNKMKCSNWTTIELCGLRDVLNLTDEEIIQIVNNAQHNASA